MQRASTMPVVFTIPAGPPSHYGLSGGLIVGQARGQTEMEFRRGGKRRQARFRVAAPGAVCHAVHKFLSLAALRLRERGRLTGGESSYGVSKGLRHGPLTSRKTLLFLDLALHLTLDIVVGNRRFRPRLFESRYFLRRGWRTS